MLGPIVFGYYVPEAVLPVIRTRRSALARPTRALSLL